MSRAGLPEPTRPDRGRAEGLLDYLDYFRATAIEAVAGLSDADARGSRLPSGWSPLELVVHLTHVERRWLVWGFEGEDVDDPWADEREGRWVVPDGQSVAEVVAALTSQGEQTRRIVARHGLDEVGRPGPRWREVPPATLERVLVHLVQEYARHCGHLDVAVELAGGALGE